MTEKLLTGTLNLNTNKQTKQTNDDRFSCDSALMYVKPKSYSLLYLKFSGPKEATSKIWLRLAQRIKKKLHKWSDNKKYMSRITQKCVFEHFRPGMIPTGLLSYSD